MRRTNDLSDEPLGLALRLAHRVALTLIALSTMLLLVVLIKERVVGRQAWSSPSSQTDDSWRTCSPIESACPMRPADGRP